MTANRPVRRALVSVSDKQGLNDLARRLHALGIEIVSTGGTAKAIAAAGVPVRDVSNLTGFPEIMDGRVKTLHPKVHGGLLAMRGNPQHQAAQKEHDIGDIDLLLVNLYPFEATLATGCAYEALVENIDVGGPAMARAAAKNHASVTVVVDAEDYKPVLAEMEASGGATSAETRRRLAAMAFARTGTYDAEVSSWLLGEAGETAPRHRAFGGRLLQPLRYGENPHQWAAFYASGTPVEGVVTARQVHGKALSYNNINDTDAAFECVAEFDAGSNAACVIVKHANPCGVALGESVLTAYRRALACDPVSAFGGIVALNRPLDAEAAQEIAGLFTEVIIAPGAEEEAIAILAAKKDLRLLLTAGLPNPRRAGVEVKSVSGGLLVQSRDAAGVDDGELKVVTRRRPRARELADLRFAFQVAKHVKSNAVVYVRDGATVGIGAGQMSRVDSSRIAARKAEDAALAAGLEESLTRGSVVASDAFFPFADGLLSAAEAGATAVIQPGGSVRDEEIIAAADEAGLAMVFTGVRHFRH